jgi:hypothetical protein
VDQYFSGYAFTHGDTQARRRLKGRELGGLFRAEQRRDGFVSVDFEADGGELVTEPFTFSGDKLVLNVNTGASGEGRVAILDESGNEIAPFTLENCRYLSGNFFDVPVQWGDDADVSSLAGKPIRLKFVMRNAKLYSFQFVDR